MDNFGNIQNFNQPQPTTPPTNPTPHQASPQAPNSSVFNRTAQLERNSNMYLIIAIVIGVLAFVFLILFVWMTIQWNDAKTDVDGQIKKAVAVAVNQKETELESEFTEKEKYPFSTFAGPADYGELTFEYPKTWSVYVAEEANQGEDFSAYLNPGQVNPVGDETIMSLRVKISSYSVEDILSEYNRKVEEGEMQASTRMVNGVSASIFEGTLPSDLKGVVAVFRIRDKSVIMQTDALQFKDDFMKILDSVKYKK